MRFLSQIDHKKLFVKVFNGPLLCYTMSMLKEVIIMTKKEEVIALADKYIKDVPGFPKPGIIFKDVTPVFENPEYLQKVFDVMVEELKESNIQFDKIACPEARGFLFGPTLGLLTKKGVVMARKPGKLPSTVIKESFSKEYGVDTIEMHIDAIEPNDVVLIHDDLLATGGTAKAAYNLVQHFNPKKTYMNFIIEIKDEGLHGRDLFEGIVDVTTLMVI